MGDEIVFSKPLHELHDKTIDLTPYFTEEQYRFIDADAFVHRRVLAICETPTLPNFYTAVSYVWFGVVAEPAELKKHGSFRVSCGVRSDGTPREDGGPISLKVLEYACRWASESSSSYLWVDRLCIMQTSKCDKAWQIGRMYDIYEQCEQCVVLPGGLQRLASVFEETSWADRAWTYQEAIVTWAYAVVLTSDWHRPPGEQHWSVEGECHWAYLHQLFIESADLLTGRAAAAGDERPCLIFGRNEKALRVLRRIMEYKVLNHLAGDDEETISEHIIRRLVVLGVAMRTSSRPVDMVFSVIGVVGVQDAFTDDIGAFKENERFRATLALINMVFRQDMDDAQDSTTEASCSPLIDDAQDTDNTQDTDDVQDGTTQASCSSLIDVPLWQSLELVGGGGLEATNMPSLSQLAGLLDSCNDGAELVLETARNTRLCMRRAPLLHWTFDVDQAESEESSSRAAAITLEIPEADLLKVYHREVARHSIHHQMEGVIELCHRLEVDVQTDEELESIDLSDFTVFGWSLKLEEHPCIRFYKFDISYLFQ